MVSLPPRAVLDVYGLEGAVQAPLSGGVINNVWRVDSLQGSFVLKQYLTSDTNQVRQSIAVQQAARAYGVPVPAVVPNRRGEMVTLLDGRAHILSRFVAGRLYEPGHIPAKAARRMGEVLGRLHEALALLPAGEAASLPTPDAIEKQLRSLLTIARSRRGSPVDDIAVGVLEAKLDLLSRIEAVPPLIARWTHGDYEWRNVLFDGDDEVAAVIDFDDAAYYHPARDVMRCIALSFPALEPEVDDYFAGYASVRPLSPNEVRAYVEFYRYISTFRVWPIIARYTDPEGYRPEWEALIQPFMPWDWQALSERLADIAAKANAL